MAAANHFYLHHGSPGAPQLTNVAGSLIAVLDWALDVAAAGYGGTRGWEKVYESGTTYAVYRPTTGIRPYLRVQDTTTESAYLRMYQTMTDVSTGTGPCPNGSPQSTSYCRAMKADEAGTHYYQIVGDGRYFAMVMMTDLYGSHRYWRPFCFGEFNSYDPLDTYNVVLAACGSTVGPGYAEHSKDFLNCGNLAEPFLSSSYGQTADNPGVFTLASPDGLITSSASAIHDPFGTSDGNIGKQGLASYRLGSVGLYQPFYILDSNGNSGTSKADITSCGVAFNESYFRGTLPYIYSTPYASNTGLGLGSVITDGTSEFYNVECHNRSSTNTQRYKHNFWLRTTNDEPGRV